MRGHAKAPSAGTNRAAVLAAALFAVVLLALALAAQAFAADQTYVKTYEGETDVSSFAAEGSADGQLTHPRRVAVEDSTGNVLVVDRDNDRVEVFAPTEHAAAYLTQFGAGTLEEPFGIAVDQSTGDVYVSDAGKEQVFRFSSDGAPTPAYSLDATFASPAKGAGAGQVGDFEADLAVDPTSGDLLLADPGNNRVDRYEADGTFVSSFDGSDSPDGAFTGLLDLDVAPNGDVYVVDSTGPVFVEGEEIGGGGPETCVQNYFCDGAPSRALRFDSAGAYQATVQALEGGSVGLVTVDPNNQQVLLGRVNPQGSTKILVYAPGGSRYLDTLRLPNFFTWFPSMAVGSGAAGRLYVVTDREAHANYGGFVGEVKVQVYSPVSLPEVAIDPAGAITSVSAEVSGTVNPQGSSTDWRFEYRPQGSESWTGGPSGNAGEGTVATAVEGGLSGLQPNTEYEARLVASGAETAATAGKEVASDPISFTTVAAAPIVSTRFAAPRTDSAARINGYVNPRNSATTYRFEWGPTASYGNSAPAGPAGSAGALGDQVLVAEGLSGLRPGTTYHYRLVAENSAGRVEGEDMTFTTRTAAEMVAPQRGIELVNSPDKGNQNVSGYLANEGERVVWSTMTGSPGSPQGKGSLFLAERTAAGWVSRSLLPPADQLVGEGELAYVIRGASTDYSRVVFQAGEDANYGIEGDPFYFTRYDRGTGQQQTLDYWAKGGFQVDYQDNQFFTSDDARHVYTTIRDTPVAGSISQLYDIGDGTRRLVGVLPETGEPPACGVVFNRQTNLISADGSRMYFTSRGDECSGPLHLYLYDSMGTAASGDDTVTRVSPPPVAGPDGKSIAIRASEDGRTLLYFSQAKLTAEDTNSAPDVYLWRQGQGNTCLTCIVPDPGIEVNAYDFPENVIVSRDLSHIYVSSRKHLVPGLGKNAGPSLYLFVGGQVRYISPGVEGTSVNLREDATVTPDGRDLVFLSTASGITADQNGSVEQAYRYSQQDGSVECLSCAPPGKASDAIADPPNRPFMYFVLPPNGSEARPLTDDGDTYVFNTEAALLPQDANNGPDVYEWHNGTLSLVTDGEGEYGGNVSVPLSLEGITRDGTDVLFRLSARLTGFERDDVGQLFVARTGGGFPPPVPPAACNEDACQGPLEGAPGFSQPGSTSLVGAGAARESKPRRKARCRRAPARGKHRQAGKRRQAGGKRARKGTKKRGARCARPARHQKKKGRSGHGKHPRSAKAGGGK